MLSNSISLQGCVKRIFFNMYVQLSSIFEMLDGKRIRSMKMSDRIQMGRWESLKSAGWLDPIKVDPVLPEGSGFLFKVGA